MTRSAPPLVPVRAITRASLIGRTGRWDIGFANGLISRIEPTTSQSSHEDIIDADGCVVLHGLHDHHLHLFALAASLRSLDCSPAINPDPATFRDRLRRAIPGADGSVRGVGYFESTAGELDRSVLDGFRSDVPLRIQHRSGVAWFYNSAALSLVGLQDHPDGRLFRSDAALGSLLQPDRRDQSTDLSGVSARLVKYGLTGLTDATPFSTDAELGSLIGQHTSGNIVQRLQGMAAPGVAVHDPGKTRRVAAKIILDEDRSPSFETLCMQIMLARSDGVPVAIHLTDRSTTWLALTALSEVGVVTGDRIEHGSVMDPQAVKRSAELGLTVVTNPALARERARDHQAHSDPEDVPHLWRCGSLIDAGITVHGGSDAPYASDNPWDSIRAAADRCSGDTRIGTDRDLTPFEAIALFGGTTPLTKGIRADVVITGSDEVALLRDLTPAIRATVIGGRNVTP